MKAENFINQGLEYTFKSKNNEEAILAFTKAITIDPKSSPAFLNRGNCYFKNGVYDKAIADYDSALLLCPQDINVYKIREWALYFKRWSENHKNHIDILAIVNHAIESAWEQKYNVAFDDFEQILQKCSDNAFVFYQRGLLYVEIGEPVKAINDFTETIKFAPSVAAVYYDRGNQYKKQRTYGMAIDDYTMAIKLYQQFSDAYYNRGVVFYSKGEYDFAKDDFKTALQINPDDENARINLQNIIRIKGE